MRRKEFFSSRRCGILLVMDMDPHTFQHIIRRIEQQMRCPQCGKHIPVEFPSVRMASDDYLLLQLRCDTCDAYIVLHASMQGAQVIKAAASSSVS